MHVDDGAEGTLEGAATTGIEAGHAAARAANAVGGEHGQGRSTYAGQIIHEVVQRFESALKGIAKDDFKTAFGFAGEERNTEVHRFLQLGGDVRKHGKAPET